jgi:ABC-type branched-subunit amino acid transport system ATPase component
MNRPLLELDEVHKHFGGVRAVDGVSLSVEAGSIAGLIGPNGAGKTTLVSLVAGQLVADRGAIVLDGAAIGGKKPHELAALGVARTFQSIRLYRGLTALDNVIAGMHVHRRPDGPSRLVPRRRPTAADADRQEEAARLLALVGLDPARVSGRLSSTLSYGDQRRLEIARALALRPRLLLLDEPAAGMNPNEKAQIRSLLETLNADGLTILLIDHDTKLVMGVCNRVTVLNFGRCIATGPPGQVADDQEVVAAYLGTGTPRSAVQSSPAPRAVSTCPPLLAVERLSVSYGAIEAVQDISLEVAEGEIVALIGANGAGKSTVLNTLSGLLRPRRGHARFGSLDLGAAAPEAIVRSGLVQVPEGREILGRLTVEENLLLGGWCRADRSGRGGNAGRDGRFGGARRGNRAAVESSVEEMMAKFPILGERRRLPAGQLSGGEQQMLAIARALVARPRLLLLDEPSLGLAPQLVEEVFALVERIRADGITVLLVEQNARRTLELADRAYVIETGRVVLSGTGDELRHDPQVQMAYLGSA